mmetsp:Transcript_8823/g.21156  ORF Transcript_8823/g.21156 Transcript_8823/m.21156 type:complete len:119 (-) Transcript_8823:164-520(-)
MVQSARDLNKLNDEVLLARVVAVLNSLEEQTTQAFDPIAPFITAGVMLRLHDTVQAKRGRGVWSKQASLALVVASFTGVRLKNKDVAEHIGNAQDSFLRHHRAMMKKAKSYFRHFRLF